MIADLLFVAFLYFASPFLVVILAFKLFADMAAWFGLWFAPAILGLWIGGLLLMVSPSDPNADFMSFTQVVAASHIFGFPTPVTLIIFGVLCLVVSASLRLRRIIA